MPGEPVAMVNAGVNKVGKCICVVLEKKFRLLERRLKARASKLVILEVLPVPRAGPN